MNDSTLNLAVSEKKSIGSFLPRLQLVQRAPQGLKPLEITKRLDMDVSRHHKVWNQRTNAHCRVLQVEDNAENRFIVHRYLKKDYTYESVDQGEHALDVLQDSCIDIIIMDINLGAGIDGIETARRIRMNKNYNHIAIVAVTANVSPEIKQQCFDVGMDAFLPKPFRKDDLTEAMNKVLKTKKAKQTK